MKTFTLTIKNDEFADVLYQMLKQMNFVSIQPVISEPEQKVEQVNAIIKDLEIEPIWDENTIEQNYIFNKELVVGQIDCKETVEELVSLLSQ